MPKKHYNKNKTQKEIAKKRTDFLFELAKESFKTEDSLSDKYVKLARRIAMKYRIRVDSKLKKRFCKNCYKYLVPGKNSRIRIHKSRIITYCNFCKHYSRHPVK
jgi:ribonuclease P protein subunit RPR2